MCVSEKHKKKWTGNEHRNAAGNNSWFYMGIKNKWSNFPPDKVTLKMSAVIACELVQQKELSIMGNVRAELSLTSEAHCKPLFSFKPGSWGQHTFGGKFGATSQFLNGGKRIFSDLHHKVSAYLSSLAEKYESHERKGQIIMFLPSGQKLSYSCGPSQCVSKCHERGAPTSQRLPWPHWISQASWHSACFNIWVDTRTHSKGARWKVSENVA